MLYKNCSVDFYRLFCHSASLYPWVPSNKCNTGGDPETVFYLMVTCMWVILESGEFNAVICAIFCSVNFVLLPYKMINGHYNIM